MYDKIIDIAIFSIVLILFSIFVWFAGQMISSYLKKRSDISPRQVEHIKKEKALLSQFLTDIKKNTADWMLTSASLEMQSSSTMIIYNDRRNIGVLYSSDRTYMVIKINLKNFSTFENNDPDTVTLRISGEHAKDFIIRAEYIIDRRGNELSFFENYLQERLK